MDLLLYAFHNAPCCMGHGLDCNEIHWKSYAGLQNLYPGFSLLVHTYRRHYGWHAVCTDAMQSCFWTMRSLCATVWHTCDPSQQHLQEVLKMIFTIWERAGLLWSLPSTRRFSVLAISQKGSWRCSVHRVVDLTLLQTKFYTLHVILRSNYGTPTVRQEITPKRPLCHYSLI